MLRAIGTLISLVEYEARILSLARREIRRWAAIATAIPDPVLRRLAVEAIVIDARNAEAAAAFAATAPRRLRRTTVELLVAHQILLDYVDIVGEQIADLQLGLILSRALPATIERPVTVAGADRLQDDDGYLVALVAFCRRRLWELPSASGIAQQAELAATRCAEGLAHTHTAARSGDHTHLRRWTSRHMSSGHYLWPEIAAGANSNLALLALLAAAADRATTHADASAIAAAYWPHVCVLSTLLDSLVDYERDTEGVNFSFVSQYPDARSAREGLVRTTRLSLTAVEPLRRRHVHTMIVCGVAAYYASLAAPRSLAAEVAPDVIAQLGRAATPIVRVLRWRHRASATCERRECGASGSETTRGESSLRSMAEQVPAVSDILTTIERRDWRRLKRLLDPDVHWTTAAEEHLHGPAQVIARLSSDPPPAAPAYHELRGGLLVRWIDSPG